MVPETVRLYLDTQQWNYLARNDAYQPAALKAARKALRRAIATRRLSVVGSLPLAQELAGARHGQPVKYGVMRDLALDAIENRWLLPLDERYRAEMALGGIVPVPDCYLDEKRMRGVRAVLSDVDDIEQIALSTKSKVTSFRVDQQVLQETARAHLQAAGSVKLSAEMAQWLEDVDIAGWVSDIIEEGGQRTFRSRRGPDADLRTVVPSAWAFTAFKLVRIKLNLGDRRAIKEGDYFDAEHFAACPYFDVLVTDDKAFRETIQLTPIRFEVRNFQWLLGELRL